MTLLLFLLACQGASFLDDPGSGVGPIDSAVEPPEPTWSVVFDAPGAFAAGQSGELEFEVDAEGAGALYVAVLDEDGAALESWEKTISTDTWTGAFQWLDSGDQESGAYTLYAALSDADGALQAEAEQPLLAVEVGFASALAEGDGGATAERIPLYWHEARSLQDEAMAFAQIDGGGAFPPVTDDLGGEPAGPPSPAPGDTGLAAPEEGGEGLNEPVAWIWDSRPILTLIPQASWTVEGVEIAAEGWEVISDGDPGLGDPLVLQRSSALGDGPGVIEEELLLELSFGGDPLMTQALPLRFYALLDAPGFQVAEGDAYHPWAAAVDPALRAIQGVSPDHDAVLDALVDWIFYDQGLSYDHNSGASAYTDYRGGWERAHFYFSDFLARRFGSVINCSDCASILTAYANMIGAPHSYRIILSNFELNEILAVGATEYSSCPFPPRGCSFSYHAVTSDDGSQIWDATLALDGDDDPGSAPSTLLQVQGVSAEEYLDRLVRSGRAEYQYLEQGTLQ